MTIQEQFEFDMTNGEEIDNMKRSNGYYLGYNDDETRTVLFDNGNQYTLNPKNEVTERIDAEDEIFIDRQIIKTVNDFIKSNPKLTKDYDYSNSNYNDYIEIQGISKDEKKQLSFVIKIVISRDFDKVDIPNIIIPRELKHNGYGKSILKEIFSVTQKHNYSLYLVQMVESFYERMVKRGAEIIEQLDVVQITKKTNLS
ncbi:MAG: hypothetical protein HRT69_18475 [Flavobacteriaceae bacterium]|nr:hypothetical protein [Flavobacteriaceae bacterium]